MSDGRTNGHHDAEGEQELRRLLVEAGPRPSLPEEDLAQIREAAGAHWRRLYGRPAAATPRWRHPALALLAAAAVAAAVGLVGWWRAAAPSPAGPRPLATLEALSGSARLAPAAGAEPAPAAAGSALLPGAVVETAAASHLALRMSGGVSVRLDAGTRLRLASAQRLVLERGAVYLDSGPAPREAARLAVATPAGLFAEVGTQFEVRVADGDPPAAARLRVREGRVELRRDGTPIMADAGEELVVRGDGGLVRRPVTVYGDDWDWVLAAAPRLEIEGLAARRFLEWIARESGRRLEFADARAAAIAEAAVLHGSIAHLDLEEAARVALASCGLGHRAADGALVVFVADDLRTPR